MTVAASSSLSTTSTSASNTYRTYAGEAARAAARDAVPLTPLLALQRKGGEMQFLLRVALATDADIQRAIGVAARSTAYFRSVIACGLG